MDQSDNLSDSHLVEPCPRNLFLYLPNTGLPQTLQNGLEMNDWCRLSRTNSSNEPLVVATEHLYETFLMEVANNSIDPMGHELDRRRQRFLFTDGYDDASSDASGLASGYATPNLSPRHTVHSENHGSIPNLQSNVLDEPAPLGGSYRDVVPFTPMGPLTSNHCGKSTLQLFRRVLPVGPSLFGNNQQLQDCFLNPVALIPQSFGSCLTMAQATGAMEEKKQNAFIPALVNPTSDLYLQDQNPIYPSQSSNTLPNLPTSTGKVHSSSAARGTPSFPWDHINSETFTEEKEIENSRNCPNPQCKNAKTKKGGRKATKDRPFSAPQISSFVPIYNGELCKPRLQNKFEEFIVKFGNGELPFDDAKELRLCRSCRNDVYRVLRENGVKKSERKSKKPGRSSSLKKRSNEAATHSKKRKTNSAVVETLETLTSKRPKSTTTTAKRRRTESLGAVDFTQFHPDKLIPTGGNSNSPGFEKKQRTVVAKKFCNFI